jgi:DNA-directed RNA polymerase specialized sigma24 family protein
VAKANLKRDWVPTEAAFQRLLMWLDEGADSQGERYVEIRSRLVHYFDRRSCLAAEDLADETLNRVARRLDEEGEIASVVPARYCYIVAKFVFLEYLRRPTPVPAAIDAREENTMIGPRTPRQDDAIDTRQAILDCLDGCLDKRPASDRQLILDYYGSESTSTIEHRKRLAARLGLSANALAIRACRIRGHLESCVKQCRDEPRQIKRHLIS